MRFRWLKLEMWMSGTFAEKLNLGGRWILAAACLLLVFQGGFFMALFMAFLIAPEVSILSSSGFTSFIDAVFFPGGREAKPPFTLKLARFYAENQRFDEAEAEYIRMLSFYPDQPEAWEERLALAFQRPAPADPGPAKVLAAAFKALSKPADRDALHRRFMQLTP